MESTSSVPKYGDLITATYAALKILGGSGKNEEIEEKASEVLSISDEILEIPHLNGSLSEINYRLAWARTLLKKHGAITNSARGVWSITPEFSNIEVVDGDAIEKAHHKGKKNKKNILLDNDPGDMPEEVRPWHKKLYNILVNMDIISLLQNR